MRAALAALREPLLTDERARSRLTAAGPAPDL
jgi:hypothetical protein